MANGLRILDRSWKLGIAMLMLCASLARAEWQFEYMEGKECSVGGDIRVRLTHFDRDVINQDGALPNGPAVEYLRVRERVWGCFDLAENACVNVRLVNRWHSYSSMVGNNSAQDGSRWTFPDEVVVDQLNLTISDIMDGKWSMVIGRQDIVLGNGMVMLEGTPYDQGRTIYFDGITAKYQDDCNTLTLLALYNEYKDTTAFINDQNRRLRRGDTYVFGGYWTHNFNQNINTDLYYLWIDIDDDDDATAEREHPADENAVLSVAGVRVFGSPDPQLDYSIEIAKQFGDFQEAEADMTGMMIDARLTLKAEEGTALSPSLDLEYTKLTGDDPASADEFEGWHPVFAEYPIWREELLPILFNGNWSNLSQYRAALNLTLADNDTYSLKVQASVAQLLADYGEAGTGGGDTIGQLYSGFVDVAMKKTPISFALELAQFEPGDYYDDGHTAEWIRFQTYYKF